VGPTRRPELRPRGTGRRQSRAVPGRGFHSSTSQLNLSRFCHQNHATYPTESAHVKPKVEECPAPGSRPPPWCTPW